MGDGDLERHRVLFIGLAIFTVDLLRSLVPVESVAIHLLMFLLVIYESVCCWLQCLNRLFEQIQFALSEINMKAYETINLKCIKDG